MENKILTATCRFCPKEFESLYEKQLTNSVNIHELNCPQRKNLKGGAIENEENKSND